MIMKHSWRRLAWKHLGLNITSMLISNAEDKTSQKYNFNPCAVLKISYISWRAQLNITSFLYIFIYGNTKKKKKIC